jgi:hypothetical protein
MFFFLKFSIENNCFSNFITSMSYSEFRIKSTHFFQIQIFEILEKKIINYCYQIISLKLWLLQLFDLFIFFDLEHIQIYSIKYITLK